MTGERAAAQHGLAQVAHAIRRSAALNAAIALCPPDASEADVLATADRMATWLRGGATDQRQDREGFLGRDPWGQ